MTRYEESGSGEWFRGIADAGHFGSGGMGGRQIGTVQGIYIATPGGELLASGNKQDADYAASLMKQSLRDFDKGEGSEADPVPVEKSSAKKAKATPPESGLVLDVVLRRIYPRKLRTAPGSAKLHIDDDVELNGMERMMIQRMQTFGSWKSEEYWHVPWNRDRAWFTKEEAAEFVPENPAVGSSVAIPDDLVGRIARLHCTDTVRAIADLYAEEDLKSASLTSRVVKEEGDIVTLVIEGNFHLEEYDIPLVDRGVDRNAAVPRYDSRSYKPELLGRAKFNRANGEFTKFEMIALGTKTGGSRFSPFEETQLAIAFRLVRDPADAASQEPRYLSYYDQKP